MSDTPPPGQLLPPGFFARLDPAQLSVPDLMALAVHDAGRPLSYEEIAARLAARGVFRTNTQLKKAWHGIPPLVRTRDGRLTLAEDAPGAGGWGEFAMLLHRARRALPGTSTGRIEPPSPPSAPKLDAETPVTRAELDETAAKWLPQPLSRRRLLALALEAHGTPLTLDAAAAELSRLEGRAVSVQDVLNSVRGQPGALRLGGDGCVALLANDPSLRNARRLLRDVLRRQREAKARAANVERMSARYAAEHAREVEQARLWYARARIAVIRWVEENGRIVGAAAFDPAAGTFADFGRADAEASLRALLERIDLVLGLRPRELFELLGVGPGPRRSVDLSPPQKTLTINRSGRQLRLSPQTILASSLGGSFRLAAEDELRRLAKNGRAGALGRRLQGDLKALWRLYEYGCAHGYVRLRWGFLDELLPVAWNVGMLPRIRETLVEAARQGTWVELVTRSAPGWEDPWSRAWRARPLGADNRMAVISNANGGTEPLLVAEIFAVRAAGEPRGGTAPEAPRDETALPENVVRFRRRGGGGVVPKRGTEGCSGRAGPPGAGRRAGSV